MKDGVIIIGGGLAGLAAGVYAQRCGLGSVILEAHTQPGGVCTSWKRGPYLMDAGLRMIIGARHPNPFHDLLCQVGIMHSVSFSRLERLHCIEDETGERVTLHGHLDALAEELHRVAPADGKRVDGFLSILDDFSRFRPDLDVEPDAARLRDGLSAARALGPVARYFLRYWKVPLHRWLQRFSSQRLRNAFSRLYPQRDFPLLAMFSSMGWLVAGQVGKPLEGSGAIARAVASTYRSLGGEIRCGARVERVLTSDGRATGVRLEGGEERHASTLISAADGHGTIFGMLGGRFMDDTIRGYYAGLPVFKPIVIVHFGARWDFGGEPENIMFPVRNPVELPDGPHRYINMHQIGSNPFFAPEGHCVIRIGFETEWEPWTHMSRGSETYAGWKERIAAQVLERLDTRYPGLAAAVERTDVATPLTIHRYTGNWKSAYEGWQPSTRTFGLRMRRTLPGLAGFYMTGQWVEPGGGVPGVIYSAHRTVGMVCRDLDRPFTPW